MLVLILVAYSMYVTACVWTTFPLVDTGAVVSIVPPSQTDHTSSLGHFNLQAVNCTNSATYGVHSLTLDLGYRHTFWWTFIIADVNKPILGADFHQNFGLLVDIQHHWLSDSVKVQGILSDLHRQGNCVAQWILMILTFLSSLNSL